MTDENQMTDDDEDIVLEELDDSELVEQMFDDVEVLEPNCGVQQADPEFVPKIHVFTRGD